MYVTWMRWLWNMQRECILLYMTVVDVEVRNAWKEGRRIRVISQLSDTKEFCSFVATQTADDCTLYCRRVHATSRRILLGHASCKWWVIRAKPEPHLVDEEGRGPSRVRSVCNFAQCAVLAPHSGLLFSYNVLRANAWLGTWFDVCKYKGGQHFGN